jgi:uncharacterized protein
MIITSTVNPSRNKPQVFVDTAAWIAILNADDSLNSQAEAELNRLLQQRTLLITTEFVLLEVADALSVSCFRQQAAGFIYDCWQSSILEVIQGSHALFAKGLSLFEQRADKDWGLTDCTSFIVMQERRIREALTSDRHFEQAGFIKC